MRGRNQVTPASRDGAGPSRRHREGRRERLTGALVRAPGAAHGTPGTGRRSAAGSGVPNAAGNSPDGMKGFRNSGSMGVPWPRRIWYLRRASRQKVAGNRRAGRARARM
jgi:hypothetical protein